MHVLMTRKYSVIIYISLFIVLISLIGSVSAADLTDNPGGSIQAAVNNASEEDPIIVNYSNASTYTYTENLTTDKILSSNTTKETISYTSDTTAPTVSSTNPVDGATNVPTNKVITVTFNENIKAGTNWFELKSAGGTSISLTSSISGKVLTITPSTTLGKGVKYNLIIHTGSVTDISGNPVALCGFYFTTDNTAPNISSTDPVDGATNVASNKVIKVTFNEPIKAGTNWFELESAGGTSIPITSSINGKVLAITPNSLANGVKYYVRIHTGSVTDLSGNNVASAVFYFTTRTNLIRNINTNTIYSKIQDAIDESSTLNGHIIEVEGICTENIVITKRLTLRSVSWQKATIQALDSSYAVLGVASSGSGSTIEGFRIKGSNNDGIILFEANNCKITENTIYNNGDNGICAYKSNQNSITGNELTNNSIGILIQYSNKSTVSGNIVKNNSNDGIFIYDSDNTSINQNNAKSNGVDGIVLYSSNNNVISGNNATNNSETGIYLLNSNGTSINQNNAKNNSLRGIRVDDSNNNTINRNNVTDNIQTGILINNSTGTSISENNVKNNGINGLIYGGIVIGYSNNTIISRNNLTQNTGNGILLLTSNNNTLSSNNLTNNTKGITLQSANSNTISMNNATYNAQDGIILLYSSKNIISRNNLNNNQGNGIYLDNSDNTRITGNTITNNYNGIHLYFSPASVNFNRITGNSVCGLYNDFSTVINATNNWWGSNTPTVSSSNASDIYFSGGNVIYDPWIVLTAESVYCSDGVTNITADLTHNNLWQDTLALGHVPNGMNVNFTAEYGTIGQTAQIIDGKAISQLISPPPHNKVNITVTLDREIISKTVNLFRVYNTVTQKGFMTLQAAIDDALTSDGDVIEMAPGKYVENIVLNKSLTIKAAPGGTVTLQASNPNLPVITINIPGSGSTISGLFITGSTNSTGILVNSSSDNNISGNNITGNLNGLNLINSTGNHIQGNIINNNTANGIYINSGQNNTISTNNIVNNSADGICLYDSSAEVHFNRITGNGRYGLYNTGSGAVNATNNWWGSNNPVVSADVSSDIYNNGTLYYNPYLVLNVSADPASTSDNSTVTADLSNNSNGDDTSSGGHVPENVPVNFTTTMGTLASPGYTRNGKATQTFSKGTVASGIANITVTLDGQSLILNIIIDAVAPTVNASLTSGLYNTTISVNLTASDTLDPSPVIYYTLDGSDPTVSSAIYTAPISITTTTTLKFMAVDSAGKKSTISTLYYIFAPVGNMYTGIGYSSIQSAISDILTLDGHVIVVGNGTYTENILLNKNLTIMPFDGNVTIQAANVNNPVITVNSGGSGSEIIGFTLKGANGTSASGIYLDQANNCTITGNIITGNYYGMLLTASQNNTIWDNNLTLNLMDGIRLTSSNNNTLYSNTVFNNSGTGICLQNSDNTLVMANNIQNNLMNGIELDNSNNSTVYENTVTGNHQSGIMASHSSLDVNFNTITGNTIYGLYNIGNSTVNATNNWWGTNNPLISSSDGSAIWVDGGNVTSNLWLVMNLTGSLIHVTHNTNSSSEITADFTRNNQGDDTSGSGAIPDGLPVNFTTTLGTIESTATTRRGKATVNLISSPTSGAAIVTATAGDYLVSSAFCKSFSSIQAAVIDPLTLDGDVILVNNGTYVENLVINKNLTLVSEGNVTVQAANSSNPVFTVSNCSNVVIYGFKIIGATHSSAIYLNDVNNCQILSNTITGNGLDSTGVFGYGIFLNSTANCTVVENILNNNLGGIDLEYSNNTLLSGNNVTNSTLRGVYLYQANNTTISRNNLEGNDCGILASYSNSLVVEGNNVENNTYQGVYLYYSLGGLHFNRIVGNGEYGLLYQGNGTVNATNNWWGTNDPVLSSDKPSDIYVVSGSVLYNPRLVLTVTPTSYKVSEGKVYESTITADLNHNSDNEDLSAVIYAPDRIPVNFTSNNGSTITNTSYTKNGKASATLILDPSLQSGLTNVTATLDGQSASTSVDRVAMARIIIASTAIDLSTDDLLYLTYDVPLNESVSWVSVLWKSTSSDFGSFQNEVCLIVNGVVVLNRTVSNVNYLNNKDLVSQKVLYNINFLNWLFSESEESKMALETIISNNPELQNLTGGALEDGILDLIKEKNGFTDSEMQLLQYRECFTDVIRTNITYPGDRGKITIQDPDSNKLIDMPLGCPISRKSTMIYANGGYTHTYGDDPANPTSTLYKDAGYEGVRSFAIVTTSVTDDILKYWVDKKDEKDNNGNLIYSNGPMKAAYGTFLTSLLVVKCHDMVADQAANQYNVTWSRTTPIVVSVFDDAYKTIMTLECDHRFGMDVCGDASNVTAFRYACSSAISPIEHHVMKVLFPGDDNGTSVTIGLGKEIFNGQMPDVFMSNGFLVMMSSADNMLLIFDPETGILRDIGTLDNSTIFGAYCFSDMQTEWAYDLGGQLNSTNPSAQPVWLGSVCGISLGTSSVLLEAGVASFEVPVVGWMVGGGLLLACGLNYLCDQYGWLPPEQSRQILGFSPPFALVNLLVYNEKPFILEKYDQICSEALYLLDNGKHNPLIRFPPAFYKENEDNKPVNIGGMPIPDDGDKAKYIINLYRDSIKNMKNGAARFQAGNVKGGTGQFLWGVFEFHMANTYLYTSIVAKELHESLPK